MSVNDKSRCVSQQLVYHYTNMYTVELVGPSLKNKVCFSKDDSLRHSTFMEKYASKYTANKNHAKANFLYWVKIYGSRTLFITLVLGYLLYVRNYSVLMWCALFGTVMPITDAFLAYEAQAPFKVVFKHIATMVFLLVTFFVLKAAISKKI